MIQLDDLGALANAVPMYLRVYHDIKKKITSYKFLPDEQLSSEQELGLSYGVSRQTIRRAIQILVNEGLVIRSQGKTSHVRPLSADSSAVSKNLSLGGINKPEVLITQFHIIFAQQVFELTSGKLRIDVHHSSDLGNGKEQIAQVSSGEQDMFGAAVEWLEVLETDWGITSVPFLFDNIQHLKQYVRSPINEEMKKNTIKQHGIRILADNWYRPSRILLARKPCFTLKDLAGMRMAVPGIPFYEKIWHALGTEPVNCQWGSEKNAFINNKIDIADAPMDSLLQHKLHKVAPYLTDANHLFSRACITINESVFQSLNSNFQEALTLAANKVGDLFSKKISKSYAKDEEKVLEEKACIIRINTRKFQQKVDQFLVNESTNPDFPFDVYKYIKEKL